MYPLSLVTKMGSSFVYESSHYVRGRASIGYTRYGESVLRDVVRFCCNFSHFMYHGLVTSFTYIVFFDIYIYIYYMMYVFLHLCLTFVVYFLSLYTCFFFYTTSLYFTIDALMNLV